MKRIIMPMASNNKPALSSCLETALHHDNGIDYFDYLIDSTAETPTDALYAAGLSEDGLSITVNKGSADSFPSIFDKWPVWLGMTSVQKESYLAAQLATETAKVVAVQKDADDVAAAKAYTKLNALKTMSPAEIQTWVTANVNTLAQAKDAIMTLAIGLSILARRL
jgi:hypothetical protein